MQLGRFVIMIGAPKKGKREKKLGHHKQREFVAISSPLS
jgi:hypothetical protein